MQREVRVLDDGVIVVVVARTSVLLSSTTYWYFDLQRRLKSIWGREDEPPSVAMNDEDVEWVNSQYGPLINQCQQNVKRFREASFH